MPDLLEELLASTRDRVARTRATTSIETLQERVGAADRGPRRFRDALGRPGVAVIAEVKRASPSRGDLAPDIDAATQARAYADAGVAAVSVLTEPDRFKGSLDDLAEVATVGIPALRKDFVVDEYMLWEAAAAGAAAVLLIVAALDPTHLRDLHDTATGLGLDVLVEVHDEDELAVALAVTPAIVGVNARDLRTFAVDRDAFARLRSAIPAGVLTVAESGIRDADDVRRAAAAGADAVLVGESLVTAADPGAAAAALVEAGRAAVEGSR